MPWSSMVKSVTHFLVEKLTGDKEIADRSGHYAGAIVAIHTLDATYPIMQGGKGFAKVIAKEVAEGEGVIEAGMINGAEIGLGVLTGESFPDIGSLVAPPFDECNENT